MSDYLRDDDYFNILDSLIKLQKQLINIHTSLRNLDDDLIYLTLPKINSLRNSMTSFKDSVYQEYVSMKQYCEHLYKLYIKVQKEITIKRKEW